jgi:hypothetical protein
MRKLTSTELKHVYGGGGTNGSSHSGDCNGSGKSQSKSNSGSNGKSRSHSKDGGSNPCGCP